MCTRTAWCTYRQWRNRFVKDPHEIVKPGQIVKVKVMEVDLKRQRISLTMRLDATSSSVSRSDDNHVKANANAESGARERRPHGPDSGQARTERCYRVGARARQAKEVNE